MAERLTCAECGARVAEDATRCPACGGRRLLAPASLLGAPWLRIPLYTAIALVLAGMTFIALSIPLYLLSRAGFSLPGEQARRAQSLEYQLDVIRDAERSLPSYPGAVRVQEHHDTTAGGTARTLAVCWRTPDRPIPAGSAGAAASADRAQAPGSFEAVRQYYGERLGRPGSGWRRLGGQTLAFRQEHVSVILEPPEEADPPCAGTFQLLFAYRRAA